MAEIGFRPLLEQWGEFVLDGGLVLHGRFTMTFVETGHSKDDVFGEVRTNTLLEVRAPKEAQGKPTKNLGNLDERPIVKKFDKWETRQEALSIYILDDGSLLRFRYTPKNVRQTDAFNKHGEPILLVDSNTELTRDPSFNQIKVEVKKDQVARKRKKLD